jgi:hypothetical protein
MNSGFLISCGWRQIRLSFSNESSLMTLVFA